MAISEEELEVLILAIACVVLAIAGGAWILVKFVFPVLVKVFSVPVKAFPSLLFTPGVFILDLCGSRPVENDPGVLESYANQFAQHSVMIMWLALQLKSLFFIGLMICASAGFSFGGMRTVAVHAFPGREFHLRWEAVGAILLPMVMIGLVLVLWGLLEAAALLTVWLSGPGGYCDRHELESQGVLHSSWQSWRTKVDQEVPYTLMSEGIDAFSALASILTRTVIALSVGLPPLYFASVLWGMLGVWRQPFLMALRSRRPSLLLEPLLAPAPSQSALTNLQHPAIDHGSWRSQLWNDASFTDCLIACDGREWRAHRFILSQGSPVLARLFSTGMTKSSSGIVKINDASHKEIDLFLKFLYTGSTQEFADARTWGGVLVLADMYEVQDLVSLCRARVIETVTAESIVSTLQLLQRYEHHPGIQATFRTLKAKVEADLSLRKVITDFALRQTTAQAC